MTQDLTPDQPMLDSNSSEGRTPPAPPAGQPIDWESRYKGLQREQNKLDTAVKNKDQALLALQQQFETFKTSQSDAYRDLQTQHTTLQSTFNQTETAARQHQAKVAELEGQVAQFTSKDTQRKLLVGADGGDLVDFFESGDLNIAGLEGDALKAKLTDFRSRASKIAQQQFNGSQQQTPPPSANLTGMSVEQLEVWLQDQKNFVNPQYDAMNEAFLSFKLK